MSAAMMDLLETTRRDRDGFKAIARTAVAELDKAIVIIKQRDETIEQLLTIGNEAVEMLQKRSQ